MESIVDPLKASALLPAIALIGPTAVGKTEISILLAEALAAEIINADSMQVYRGMDIATAKVSPADRARIRHHLVDILDPDQPFSVAQYQKLAQQAIADICSRHKIPLLVGGSGLYLRAALTPYSFSAYEIDYQLRSELQQRALAEGGAALLAELQEVDAAAAAKLHPNDTRRIIRALEFWQQTGETISSRQKLTAQSEPLYNVLWLGLTRDREDLYQRIDARVLAMIAAGLPEEMEYLRQQGFDLNSIAGQALGYKEMLPWLEGRCSQAEAIARLQQETRRYAKRQLSWFRSEPGVIWLNLSHTSTAAAVQTLTHYCQEALAIR